MKIKYAESHLNVKTVMYNKQSLSLLQGETGTVGPTGPVGLPGKDVSIIIVNFCLCIHLRHCYILLNVNFIFREHLDHQEKMELQEPKEPL